MHVEVVGYCPAECLEAETHHLAEAGRVKMGMSGPVAPV